MVEKRGRGFERRVHLEREALAAVNGGLRHLPALPGLTRSAVASWVRKIQNQVSSENLADLKRVLLQLASQLERYGDDSRMVFHEEDESVLETTRQGAYNSITVLKAVVARAADLGTEARSGTLKAL